MIIFLNGTSSSGKTSIAKNLLKLTRKQFVHIEMDDVFEKDPVQELRNNNTIYFHRPSYARLQDVVNDSKDVILDGFLVKSKELIRYIKPFLCSTTYFIKVIASLEKCNEREINRGDRLKGTTASLYNLVYASLSDYDLIIDTTADIESSVSAAKILEFIVSNNNPQAFKHSVQKAFALHVENLKHLNAMDLNKVLDKMLLHQNNKIKENRAYEE